jgi:predicted deacetylase
MYFCVRDDDTSFFTAPEELERAYEEVMQWGPVSLAVVPFHRAGTSKAVPEKFRGRGSVHSLHENRALVEYLRAGVSERRFEIMLHGYHHDEPSDQAEFFIGSDLARKVIDGRKYLEDLIGASIRVFVPPHNKIGRAGLRAIVRASLHLGCTAGVRSGWSPLSLVTWRTWLQLRSWRKSGGFGVPWILDLGDHREIAGNAVTPSSRIQHNEAIFSSALELQGVFCAATHYWERNVPSIHAGEPTVGEQLRRLIDRACADDRVVWRSVGDVVCNSGIHA